MDILKLPSKTFLKLIGISLIIATVAGTIYYATKGGFFDGLLLTFVGLSCTYMILILSVLLFKTFTTILAKDNISVFHVIVSFLITVFISGYLFITLFKLIAGEFKV